MSWARRPAARQVCSRGDAPTARRWELRRKTSQTSSVVPYADSNEYLHCLQMMGLRPGGTLQAPPNPCGVGRAGAGF